MIVEQHSANKSCCSMQISDLFFCLLGSSGVHSLAVIILPLLKERLSSDDHDNEWPAIGTPFAAKILN